MNGKAGRSAEQLFVGDSPAVRRLLKVARLVAATDVNVLLLGESGTGKRVLARSLHRWGPRATSGFVSIRCSGLDQDPELKLVGELTRADQSRAK